MAKKTVKVDIPAGSPDAMIDLGKAIVKKHKADAANSPLANGDVDMAIYETNIVKADKLRSDATDLYKQAEQKMQEARQILGIDKGQNINNLGSTYSDTDVIRTRLLGKYKGKEESLGIYGFNVVIGTAKMPVRKAKA